ncbi:hypothetical protein ACFL9S_11095 [Erwinia sp. AnSW2-5]|uniref:hypothetical protein n=1 Tax=Erwinia sp. AnSW2-5 TaxID=3367692 RepID=UPI00385C804F
MKFIEIVGNKSTSATFKGRKIGHNVNAVAYEDGDNIVIRLESNGAWVKYASQKVVTKEQYNEFCKQQDRPLFVRGIEAMGAEVML